MIPGTFTIRMYIPVEGPPPPPGMTPATAMSPYACPGCGRQARPTPLQFRKWWMQRRPARFESLLEFLIRINVCRCETWGQVCEEE